MRGGVRSTVFESDGVEFQGRVIGGQKEGLGTLCFPDGSSLRGVWRDDQITGFAVYDFDDYQQSIQGSMEEGLFTGQVTETIGGKVVFEGQYSENMRNGLGKLWLADGGFYEGEFKDGVLDGNAIYNYPDCDITLKGTWKVFYDILAVC